MDLDLPRRANGFGFPFLLLLSYSAVDVTECSDREGRAAGLCAAVSEYDGSEDKQISSSDPCTELRPSVDIGQGRDGLPVCLVPCLVDIDD